MRFCLIMVAAMAAASACADTSAGFSVDWRGLPNVEGILKDNSKAHYGFVNFVAFGPGWQYTAQDYAAKGHKKEAVEDPKLGKGLLFTGKIWAGKTGLAIREEFYDVSKGGAAKAHVRWTISSLDGNPMGLERAYIRFPLSRAEFAGGKAGTSTLPDEYGEEWIGVGSKDKVEIVSKDGTKKLLASVRSGSPVVQDARKDKQDRFEFRIDFPDAKTAKSSTIEFEVAGAFADSLKKPNGKVKLDLPPPPAKIAAGEDWVEFPFTNEIRPGSILDFSIVMGAVASLQDWDALYRGLGQAALSREGGQGDDCAQVEREGTQALCAQVGRLASPRGAGDVCGRRLLVYGFDRQELGPDDDV